MAARAADLHAPGASSSRPRTQAAGGGGALAGLTRPCSRAQGYFYYIFGFCFVVGALTVLITVEVAIVCTYVQLCAEDYLWWCAPGPETPKPHSGPETPCSVWWCAPAESCASLADMRMVLADCTPGATSGLALHPLRQCSTSARHPRA